MTAHLAALIVTLSMGADVEADYVIRGGRLYDGSGVIRTTDLAIKGDRIVAVGAFSVAGKPRVIDAKGLIVAPGFIDLHTHSDYTIVQTKTRRNTNYLMQGVTTVVTGNCGWGQLDVDKLYRHVETEGAGTNVAHLIPQGALRRKVMGVANRPPTAAELKEMQALVDSGMGHGAWGLSTGLSYLPGSFSSTEELTQLNLVVAKHHGFYASHIRNQGSRLLDAVQEAIDIGKNAKVPVHISHLKVAGRKNWGTASAVIRLIEEARRKGHAVTADQYPYHASSTSLVAMMIPPSVRSNGNLPERLNDLDELPKIRKIIAQRIQARDGPQFLIVASHAARRAWQGKSLADLARQEKTTAVEIALTMLRKGGAKMINYSMSEEEVRQIMQAPFVATASDGRGWSITAKDRIHPRSYGTFPRKIGLYAGAKKTLPLEQALRSSTGLPADILKLPERGYLKKGHFADIVLFDPGSFRDTATFARPHQHARGVRFLFVNGVLAVDQGKPTNVLAGKALRHLSKR